MKALIDTLSDNLVTQVEQESNIFEVAYPFMWVNCNEEIIAHEWRFVDNEFIKIEPTPISAEHNKTQAIKYLLESDWTAVQDVGDSVNSKPYLVNQAEFIVWRNKLRAIAVSPIEGDVAVFAEKPQEIWGT
jgi:hypothetical protein